MIKKTILILFFGIQSYGWAQQKDTLIGGTNYSYNYKKHFICSKKLKSLGNFASKKVKNGVWIIFMKDGSIKSIGNYKNNLKVGRWWFYEIEFYDYSEEGKLLKKGRGCFRCPSL